MFSNSSNDLNYLINQFNNELIEQNDFSKSARIASRIVDIYLQRNDHQNALEWLGHWLDLEPENEQVHQMIEHLDCLRADERRALEERKAAEKSKSSYFTLKNFLILGLAVWAFSSLKNIR